MTTEVNTDNSENTLYFSCKELAEMRLPGKPATRQGWDVIVNAEKWPYIEVNSRGRKGKTRKYHPPQSLMNLINLTYPSDKLALQLASSRSGRRQLPQEIRPSGRIERLGDSSSSGGDEYMIESIDFNPYSNLIDTPLQHLKIFTVKGTSLQPSIHDGDEVLVDVRCNSFDDNAIYVIGQGDIMRIKRIQLRLDGTVVVRNDNDGDLPPEVYTTEEAKAFNVIGKVVPFKFGRFNL
ncbi:S24 family peptidase [Methylobacillus glycogenes]|uniref:S24 family peptidase n=1 Tax=Methylobacillus glycogenes TaxID=406 RepID=UPI00046F08C3|nr:S24 family peptidase [Methylobacillus glycogenes]MBL8505817.1 S24 family peptidase [Methylobacillus glycogenes]